MVFIPLLQSLAEFDPGTGLILSKGAVPFVLLWWDQDETVRKLEI